MATTLGTPTGIGPATISGNVSEIEASPPPPAATPAGPDDAERSYVRSVAIAWLAGIPVIATLVAVLVLAVGDASVGGAIGVGLFAGIWAAPLAGVVGIGVWASKHH